MAGQQGTSMAGIRGGTVAPADAADAFLSSPRVASFNTRRAYAGVLDRLAVSSLASVAPPASPACTRTGLRHTLATQAINRGMRLEAVAALPGHRKVEMTLISARAHRQPGRCR